MVQKLPGFVHHAANGQEFWLDLSASVKDRFGILTFSEETECEYDSRTKKCDDEDRQTDDITERVTIRNPWCETYNRVK